MAKHTPDALITIQSEHRIPGGDANPDVMHVTCPAFWKVLNGTHYIRYEEYPQLLTDQAPGTPAKAEGAVQVLIRLSPDGAQIRRTGQAVSLLLFDPNEKRTSDYGTPYGTFEACTEVYSYTVTEAPDTVRLSMQYALYLDGSHISDCTLALTCDRLPASVSASSYPSGSGSSAGLQPSHESGS